MIKYILTAIVFYLTIGMCHSQTPNVVQMKLEPFPTENWYISILGYYGRMDYAVNKYISDAFELHSSSFIGTEGDENAERAISILYKWGGSKYQIQVITDLEVSNKYKMKFSSVFETFDLLPPVDEEDEKYTKEYRSIEAYAVIKGQPIGLRLFKQGETEPFKEIRYDDPGEPPKLWVKEMIFAPEGIVADEDADYEIVELDGEGYEAGITSAGHYSKSTDISYDGGATWNGCSGFSTVAWRPDQLERTAHPIIKFTAYSRMRRYVKYYTYKKGFSDQPGGPYEPITITETNDDPPETEETE